MPQGRFLFLGTGGSMGVPIVGCHCAVCKSKNPCDSRMRSSALISYGNRDVLIDSGPDFRSQALRFGIDNIDGVIFTHAHYDHTAAVDELRIFSLRSGQPLPCLLSNDTLRDLRVRFYYIFEAPGADLKLTTNLSPQILDGKRGNVAFLGQQIKYATYSQGGMQVNGFRFGNLAYIIDIKEYSDDIFAMLEGVDTLILSALRMKPSHLHFTVDEAIAFAEKVKPQKTWLTHIAHELEHDEINKILPSNIFLSYDGLEVFFDVDEVII